MTSAPESKTDFVERTILESIAQGDLPPGAVLEQRAVARQLGVSPTPVREALRRLETAGMVVATSRSSARVAEPVDRRDPVAIRLRGALERIFFELAVERATPAALADLAALNGAYATAEGDRAHALHWEFHFRMFELAGSPLLQTHLKMLWSALERNPARHPPRPAPHSHQAHTDLLTAIADGDIEHGVALLQQHLSP